MNVIIITLLVLCLLGVLCMLAVIMSLSACIISIQRESQKAIDEAIKEIEKEPPAVAMTDDGKYYSAIKTMQLMEELNNEGR